MKLRYLIFGIIGLIILSGCNGQEVVCNKPYIRVGTDCCLDNNDNGVCDVDEVEIKEKPKLKEVTCNKEEILSTMCCVESQYDKSFCDPQGDVQVNLGDIECEKPYIKVTNLCCQDKNNNNLCDHIEELEKEEEEEPIPEPILVGTILPSAYYTDTRHVPRTVKWTTPQWDTKPSFFWSTPYYSEPAIKGYWVSIDSETWWTLVKPPTGKNWRSPNDIAEGTHTFRIVAEYGDGNFGKPGSVYFTISSEFPDISVGEITWEPTLFREGSPALYKVDISAVIKNAADKDFIGADNLPVTAIAIYLHVNGAWRTTANSLTTLFAWEEKKVTFKPIYLAEGEYELQVLVDQSDTIKESDEDNNEKSVMVDLG